MFQDVLECFMFGVLSMPQKGDKTRLKPHVSWGGEWGGEGRGLLSLVHYACVELSFLLG